MSLLTQPTIVKIELVKVQTVDQRAACLGFEAGQVWRAELTKVAEMVKECQEQKEKHYTVKLG